MMKLEAKTGDIIRISGAYSKNDNGLFVVIHSFGDADWNGCEGEYWIEKLKRNGEISTAKYSGTFYPLHSYSNNREYVRKSSEWNEQNIVVKVVEGVNTSYIIDYFKNEAEQAKKQKEYYTIRGYEWEHWGKQYADSEAFYNSVIERLSAPQEKTETEQEEPKQEETEPQTEQTTIQAQELKKGNITIWNYGYKSEVIGVEPSKTGKTINVLLRSFNDGIVRNRKMKACTLVAIEL